MEDGELGRTEESRYDRESMGSARVVDKGVPYAPREQHKGHKTNGEDVTRIGCLWTLGNKVEKTDICPRVPETAAFDASWNRALKASEVLGCLLWTFPSSLN